MTTVPNAPRSGGRPRAGLDDAATRPVLLALPGNEDRAQALARLTGTTSVSVEVRRFPDEESYVRLPGDIGGRDVVLVCTLDRPDAKLLPVLFAAATARELGARRVGLVAPYLAYMRQDRRFHPGEAVTARVVARLLSGAVDWLVTVDPHLHRIHDLAEIYSVPTTVVHAAPTVARWIAREVPHAVLVGPDEESAQWVRAIADQAGVPVLVLEKVRRGDREVSVSVPDVARWRGHTPVLVDDIISTARTMTATIIRLRDAGMAPPVCVGVHAIFAGDAADALAAAGAARVVTCDTVTHPTNGISLGPAIAEAVAGYADVGAPRPVSGNA